MKNHWLWWVAVLLIGCSSYAFAPNNKVWQKLSSGIDEPDIKCVVVHPTDNKYIFVGTSRALYRSVDYGKNYERVLQLGGNGKAINTIYISAEKPESILAATDDGLFLSSDNGDQWERIYESPDAQSQRCLTVVTNGNIIYLGTAKGFFYKSVDSSVWNRSSGELGDRPVYKVAQDDEYIYAATDTDLYRFNKAEKIADRVFKLSEQAAENLAVNVGEAEENGFTNIQRIKDVLITEDDEPFIYLATESGIFCSTDHGKNWEQLFRDGLPVEHLTSIAIFPKEDTSHGENKGDSDPGHEKFNVLAGTSEGVYQQEQQGWTAIYRGMETNDVQSLSADEKGNVYAGTDQGVFHLGDEPVTNFQMKKVIENLSKEPSIRDVQQWAVDYAEVNPEKIKKWRSAAGRKALLPNLSVGLNRSASELLHWDSGPNPDNLLKGRDFMDWDLSVSWDLGDLIWNSDQTSIDSRSKLMVELREDVLDQVTRLYFERRRMQVGMAASSDSQQMVDRQMRVEELTALIDALTGGKFSKNLAE